MMALSWSCNLGEHESCDTKDCECDCHGFDKEIEPYGN